MNALQGSLMRFQRCSATVKKSRCIIRKKTNLLQRNAETMTLSQGTDRLVFSKGLRERTLLIIGSGLTIIIYLESFLLDLVLHRNGYSTA